jgi:hypothetical protein
VNVPRRGTAYWWAVAFPFGVSFWLASGVAGAGGLADAGVPTSGNSTDPTALTLPGDSMEPEATASPGPGSMPPPRDCQTSEDVVVGFQRGMAIGEREASTRVRRVLARAFPLPCYKLSFKELNRSDVASAVVDERVSLGLIAVPPPQGAAEGSDDSPVIEDRETRGVSSLPLMPASYSVVVDTSAPEHDGGGPVPSWVWGAASALVGAFLLTLVAWALNARVPSPLLWGEQGIQRLDARLKDPQRVWGWIFSSKSGGVLGLVWALLGVGVYLIWPRAVPSTLEPHKAVDLEGAVRAAYPGRTLQEYRAGVWVPCAQPHRCLNDFVSKKSTAVAGDRDLLCYFAKATGVGDLQFDADGAAVPMLQVFLLPSSSTHGPVARSLKASLLDAMRVERGPASPWSSCSPEESGAAP